MIDLRLGDCLDVLRDLDGCSVDAIVTDPPYGLSFMGKHWDYDVPSEDIWRECLRVLKPGGHLLAFAGTRTQHRIACNIEDAGFEIRDMIAWVYGSGFPKSLDVSKAIDKHGGQSVAWFGPWFRCWREEKGVTQKQVAALFPSKTGGLTGCVANWELGFNMPTPEQFNLIRDTFGLPFESISAAEREVVGKSAHKPGIANGTKGHHTVGGTIAQHVDITAPATPEAQQWQGWGTALKPALEPITVARKPFTGAVAANVLEHGTGALNIDGCRVGASEQLVRPSVSRSDNAVFGKGLGAGIQAEPSGRWPANLIHDGSDEVVGLFPQNVKGQVGMTKTKGGHRFIEGDTETVQKFDYDKSDTGSAARFFYCSKASKKDRGEGNTHPTVKPTDLMRYLCRLVTPPGGIVLDPFMGSGSTGKAALQEGFGFIGIERDGDSFDTARYRILDDVAQPPLPVA